MGLTQIQSASTVSSQASKGFPIVDIASLPDGGYVLTWMGTPNSGSDVFTTVYGANGQPVPGSTIVDVTQTDPSNDYDVQVTPVAGNRFAITWLTQGQSGPFEIYTTVYGADGQPVPGSSIVNVTNNNDALIWDYAPRVTALTGGGYALTWYSQVTGSNSDIFTVVYGPDGQPVHGPDGQPVSPTNVSNTTDIAETGVQIVALNDGGYAMVWGGTHIDSEDVELFTAELTGSPPPDPRPNTSR
jgi:hypothetical protein